MSSRAKDAEFTVFQVVDVAEDAQGWRLTLNDEGLSFGIGSEQCDVPPQKGETCALYGSESVGIGTAVRGCVIGGREYFYRNPEEQERWVEGLKKASRKMATQTYNENKSGLSRSIKKMPKPFQDRIKRFRKVGGMEWRVEFEAYEVFICVEAVKIARALKTAAEVAVFQKLSANEMGDYVRLEYDRHTGNTLGASTALAHAYLLDESLVVRMHGGMCPVSGCEKYGCWASSASAKKEREARLQ